MHAPKALEDTDLDVELTEKQAFVGYGARYMMLYRYYQRRHSVF